MAQKNKKKDDPDKRIKRATKAVKRVDGMEMSMWFGMTIAYVIFVAILSGVTKIYLPEIIYLGAIPIDTQYGVFALGIALWIPISMMTQAYFKRD